MEITVNGEKKNFNESLTVKELVEREVEEADRLAVGVNSTVISRQQWADKQLEAGDKVEIVRPLQGG